METKKDILQYIDKRIKNLRDEINMVSRSNNENNLIETKYCKKKVFELRCKINILTDISYKI